MSNLLLAIDIGNTNMTFGIIKGKNRIIRSFDIPSTSYDLSRLKPLLRYFTIDNAIICSVVPKLTRRLSSDLKNIVKGSVIVVGRDIRVPIRNLYKYPFQVGQDRLVNAYAASEIYGIPVICVDYGTAITFDLVSKSKAYLGGLIMPGLRISLEVLNNSTALLPRVKLSVPGRLIGNQTKESMLSGVVFGAAAMTNGIIAMLKKKLGNNSRVVATGGNAGMVAKYCPALTRIDPQLTLKGLGMIFALYSRSYQRK
jgi:type III pantothenate kinase